MLTDKNLLHTSLETYGEFSFVEHLTKGIVLQQPNSLCGIGDDAAVLEPLHENILITTDMLLEHIHFNLAYTPLKHLGYKAVVVNLSDLCAMNASPTQITVSLAVSNRFSVEAIEELYAGILAACKVYGIDLIGGDTCSSEKGLILSITAIGKALPADIVYRKDAKENHLIVLSGDLGGAYMGLRILERENEVFKVNPQSQPDLSPYSYLIQRQLKPEARTDVKEILRTLQIHPSSMIDISDGLASDLVQLCQASQTGCLIYEEKIPLDPTLLTACEELNLHPSTVALHGGEDYELLFTIPLEDAPKLKAHPHFSIIGHMTHSNQGYQLIPRGNQQQVPLPVKGWNEARS